MPAVVEEVEMVAQEVGAALEVQVSQMGRLSSHLMSKILLLRSKWATNR